MSLINQVLKDLEQRHAGEVRGATRAVRPLPEDTPRRSLWIVLGLVAAGTVSGLAWWYLSPPPALARNTQPGGETISAKAAPLAANTPAPALIAPTSPVVSAPADALVRAPTMVAPGSSPGERPPPSAQALTPEISGLPRPAPTVSTGFPDTRLATRAPARPIVRQRTGAEVATAAETAPETASATSKAPAGRPSREPTPKVSGPSAFSKAEPAAGQSSADSQPDSAEPAANIEKQVRPPTERERAEAEFRGAMTALGSGDITEAETKLRAALSVDPMADRARQALLGLYIDRGRREDAEQLLEDRLRLDHRQAGFALALARLQLGRGANSEALATLQRSLPYGETSPDFQAMLANALGRLGQHKQAAERFEMAARLAPRNPVWLMGLGVELRADNRNSEARVAFQRARELGGLNPQLASFVDQQLSQLK